MNLPALAVSWDWPRLKDLVLDTLSSPHSRRVYGNALDDFRDWCVRNRTESFSRAAVQAYRAHLETSGLASSSINVRLTAVRRLAQEGADNQLLPLEIANSIGRVKGKKQTGVRMGNWLTLEQVRQLLALPAVESPVALRSRAILCLLIGCGLRRSEVSALKVDAIQLRDGRWVVLDLVGKRGRIRTVPIPAWAKQALDQWISAAGITAGPVFRPIDRRGIVLPEPLTSQSVFLTVRKLSAQLGVPFSPHDLRRTFAKLAHRGGAALEQIQLSLGHESVTTTERYIGLRQDLSSAPCDYLAVGL